MMILEYCTCVEDLPKSAPDILTKFIELLKVWTPIQSLTTFQTHYILLLVFNVLILVIVESRHSI